MSYEVKDIKREDNAQCHHKDSVKVLIVDMGGDIASDKAADDGGYNHKGQNGQVYIGKVIGESHGNDVACLGTKDDTQRGKDGWFTCKGQQDNQERSVKEAAADA